MAKLNGMFSSSILKDLIESSFGLAIGLDQTTITTEHALFILVTTPAIKDKLDQIGVDAESIASDCLEYLKANTQFLNNEIPNSNPDVMLGQLTTALQYVLTASQKKAGKLNRAVNRFDVLEELLNSTDTYASYYLAKYGVTQNAIDQMRAQQAEAGESSDSLEEYCVNLNKRAASKSLDPLVGREKELFTVAHTLSKKKKCNVILVGDPGTGKTQIVEGLAQRIVEGRVPATLRNKVIYSLDIGNVLAGCKFRGEFEDKIKSIIEGLTKNKNAILFIDEAHNMDVGEGQSQSGLGFSSMLKPELSRGNLKVIATTTWEGYRGTFEKDTALMRRFRMLPVVEPSAEESVLILKGLRGNMEQFHNCEITDAAIESAVDLTVKYQKDRHLPDKAVDVLDSACARKQVTDAAVRLVDRAAVIQEVVELTGIPIKNEQESTDQDSRVLSIAEQLKSAVFHQDRAIEQVSESLIVAHSGLKDPNRPIGSFVFVGPSGCGKTFLAKKIAEKMNMHLLKYDMSEFQEKHALSRFIGAPPGYVGFGDGGTGEGQLINDIVRNPNSVILFDEVEKAHPDVFTILLQLLDEGRATSTTGKVADARNCIIVMSSNLGTAAAQRKNLGFGGQKAGAAAQKRAVDSFFLTEIRGRITAIIEFNALDDLSYRRIVVERINDLAKLVQARKIKIVPSEELISHILELNTGNEFGARKIAAIVNSVIKYPLSVALLRGTVKNNSSVYLDWKNDELVFGSEETAKAVPVS